MAYKSIDSMKISKDNITNPFTIPQMLQYVTLLKTEFPGITHIGNEVILNSTEDFNLHNPPLPPDFIEIIEKNWITTIQNAGLGVILRGVFCEAEGIWNFPINQAGAQYYLDKTSVWLDRVKPLLNDKARISIFPESTNNAFNGKHFLGAVTPATYADFFTKLKALIASKVPNPVRITNNYSELDSGWAGSLPGIMQKTIADDYGQNGQRTVANMRARIEAMKAKYPFAYELQEWADIDGQGPSFISAMLDMFTQEGIDVNLWCGWNAGNEGILSGNPGNFTLNDKGLAMKAFFGSTLPPAPNPIPPIPVPTPPTDLTPVLEAIAELKTIVTNDINSRAKIRNDIKNAL